MNVKAIALLAALSISLNGNAQKKAQHWQLLDYQQDSVYGTSFNRAYAELLKGKKSHPVVVAVIDEGVDITHQDLKGHIWINTKEMPGNGVDDDKNGYADDIHGWNFLGGKSGANLYATSSEADREYARLLPAFAGMDSARQSQQKGYAYFQMVKKEHIKDSLGRSVDLPALLGSILSRIAKADSLLSAAIGKPGIGYNDLVAYTPADSTLKAAKTGLMFYYTRNKGNWDSLTVDSILKKGQESMVTAKKNQALYARVKGDPLQLRRQVIGDNPFDINDKTYGNNIVGDEYADHGTHCSCIIAADRNDSSGISGIADNVIILPVRAVNTLQYGDEMDKDVALAIRYAVDNGARIISMSFAKDLSPDKAWVDDAIRYAEKKNVLLVHASGNDGQNVDSFPHYPTADYLDHTKAANFINVGSISSDTGYALPAGDSDYGQDDVDLFAPGVSIYSCIPGNNYASFSGTSMAAPAVAGIAALLLEYYPQLTAIQLKKILMSSVTPLRGKMVNQPGTKKKVDFGTLCVSGGVVNAYNALKLAETTHGR